MHRVRGLQKIWHALVPRLIRHIHYHRLCHPIHTGQLVVIVLDHPIDEKTRTSEAALDWLETVLTRAGSLLDNVLVTVVLALEGLYTAQRPLKTGQTLIDTGGRADDGFPSVHRPRQSFEASNHTQMESTSTPQPERLSATAGALIIQYMDGITRYTVRCLSRSSFN